MKFHEYETIMTGARRMFRGTAVEPPTEADLDNFLASAQGVVSDSSSYSMMLLHRKQDIQWALDQKPYYSVYPSISPMLTKLQLDKVQSSHIRLPHGLKSLSLRFPVGCELGNEVRTIWIHHLDQVRNPLNDTVCQGLSLGIDHGEVRDGLPVYLIRCFPLVEKQSVEDALDLLPASWTLSEGKQLAPEVIADAVRLACTICLIGDDPSILEPEVLSKDKHRVDQSNLENLVEKARRRGKLGWSLGRSIETIPHYRRPHPALVWTGVGRKIPKIIMRSGSVVHRDAVAAVPTGYGDDEDEKPVLP